jgi:hypothetical protein
MLLPSEQPSFILFDDPVQGHLAFLHGYKSGADMKGINI